MFIWLVRKTTHSVSSTTNYQDAKVHLPRSDWTSKLAMRQNAPTQISPDILASIGLEHVIDTKAQ